MATRNSIPSDATLRTVAPTLRRSAEFVRQVVARLYEVRRTVRDGEKLQVRIGAAGSGIIPNYRVESETEMDFYSGPPDSVNRYMDAHVWGVFRGSNHKPLEDSSTDTNWCSGTMNFAEVEALLGELRKFGGRLP